MLYLIFHIVCSSCCFGQNSYYKQCVGSFHKWQEMWMDRRKFWHMDNTDSYYLLKVSQLCCSKHLVSMSTQRPKHFFHLQKQPGSISELGGWTPLFLSGLLFLEFSCFFVAIKELLCLWLFLEPFCLLLRAEEGELSCKIMFFLKC